MSVGIKSICLSSFFIINVISLVVGIYNSLKGWVYL